MEKLKKQIATLPTLSIGGKAYLSYQVVTDTVAAFIFPTETSSQAITQIAEADYRCILETADSLCRELGYTAVVKLTPPDVPLAATGLYWTTSPPVTLEPDIVVIHAGHSCEEILQAGLLLDIGHPADASLHQLGLDEVTRQHFNIPVTASDAVLDLMHHTVASDWPNDYKGLWHDILGMCVTGGKDTSPAERLFTVIVRGLGQRRYWRFKAQLQSGDGRLPRLHISLAEETQANPKPLFPLGQVVMTAGAADLPVDCRVQRNSGKEQS